MNKYKTFILGVVLGSLFAGTVGYASDLFTITVHFPEIDYRIDGQDVTNSTNRPTTIAYQGVNYVPVRWLAEHMDKKISWNAEQQRIDLDQLLELDYAQLDKDELNGELAEWVDRSLHIEMAQVRQFDGDTYVLVTRGKKGTGGYEADVFSVTKTNDEVLVKLHYADPQKGALATQVYTYPYTLIRLQGTDYPKFRFMEVSGQAIHPLTGYDYVPEIYKQSDHIILFEPEWKDGVWHLNGVVRAFEGLAVYSLLGSKGQVIEHYPIQASDRAPNWASYEFVVEQSKLNPDWSIQIHTVLSNGDEPDEMITIPVASLHAEEK